MKSIQVVFGLLLALCLMGTVLGCGKKAVTQEELCAKFTEIIPQEADECVEAFTEINTRCADPQAVFNCIMNAENPEAFEACEAVCVRVQGE